MTSRVLHEIPLRLLHRKVGDEHVTLLQACYDNPIFNEDDGGGKNFPAPPPAQNGNSTMSGGGGAAGRKATTTTADVFEDGTQDGRYGKHPGPSYHGANDYMHSLAARTGSTPDEIAFRAARRRSRCKLLLLALAATLAMVVVVALIAHLRGE